METQDSLPGRNLDVGFNWGTERVAFEDESIDGFLAVHVLEYVEWWKSIDALKEVNRVAECLLWHKIVFSGVSFVIFVSYQQAVHDIREWSKRLPKDLICVVGIPRSGVFIGSALAQHRNIIYADYHQIVAGEHPWVLGHRRTIPPMQRGTVLFVDDTVWKGRTIRQTMTNLPNPPDGVRFVYGSLYCRSGLIDLAPLSGRRCPHINHTFEWNLCHDMHSKSLATDLDGVLCEDWGRDWNGTVAEECGPRYMDYLQNARPIRIPSRAVGAIITARLEKYRGQTVDWLNRHRIPFKRLLMNGSSNKHRRELPVIETKARLFRESGCKLFIDDNRNICKQVALSTGLPTLSSLSWEGWNLETMGSWFNEPTSDTGLCQLDRGIQLAMKYAAQRIVN